MAVDPRKERNDDDHDDGDDDDDDDDLITLWPGTKIIYGWGG